MPRLLLDTNVIIRFLTGDHPTHSPRSRKLFKRAAAGEVVLVLTDLTIAEAAWVLDSFYGFDRSEIGAALQGVVDSTGIEVQNRPILVTALRTFMRGEADFVDAYHAAMAANEPIAIASFDRDFDRFADVKRVDPQS